MNQHSNSQATQGAFVIPQVARVLGYAGLLPFIASAVACGLMQGETKLLAQQALLAYGAVIVSFLGAVHWGAALAMRSTAAFSYVWSITPALLAWIALLLPFSAGTVMLALVLVVCWIVDLQTLRSHVFSESYLQLRMHLTIGALLSIVAGRLAA